MFSREKMHRELIENNKTIRPAKQEREGSGTTRRSTFKALA
jgi:hypothetical protein